MTFGITLLACYIRAVVRLFEHILESPFFGIGTQIDYFHCFGQILFIQMCWHTAVNTFIASSSTSVNSYMGIPSDPSDFPLDSVFKAFLTFSLTSLLLSHIPLVHINYISHVVISFI